MKLFPLHFDFLLPYCEESGVFVDDPAQADAILTMNQAGGWPDRMGEARLLANKHEIPLAWWTIEDPNSYSFTIHQAKMVDYIFTSDGALIERYRKDLGHARVFWLPLAASEEYHKPKPLVSGGIVEGPADFVFSGNFYPNEARRWGDETVLLPLVRAGYSLALFSYQVNPHMPAELRSCLIGDGGGCRNVAEQYRYGKIVVGNNNQCNGFDGVERTLMTSMRTFEALACGKVLLAPWTEAYEALGLTCYRYKHEYLTPEHEPVYRGEMAWSKTADRTLDLAAALLKDDHGIGERGRQFVLSFHTYGHRMARIGRALQGQAETESWR